MIGKGHKARAVPISEDAMQALQAHWRDRGVEDGTLPAGALLAPSTAARLPPRAAQKRVQGERDGYSASGLHALLLAAEREFNGANDADSPLAAAEKVRLRAHALRHTWGGACDRGGGGAGCDPGRARARLA